MKLGAPAFYASFDSVGGYGGGTGVLDEDGQHAWIGTDSFMMSNASLGFRTGIALADAANPVPV